LSLLTSLSCVTLVEPNVINLRTWVYCWWERFSAAIVVFGQFLIVAASSPQGFRPGGKTTLTGKE